MAAPDVHTTASTPFWVIAVLVAISVGGWRMIWRRARDDQKAARELARIRGKTKWRAFFKLALQIPALVVLLIAAIWVAVNGR